MFQKTGFQELMSQVDGVIFHPLTVFFAWFALACVLVLKSPKSLKLRKLKLWRFSDTWWLNALGWFAVGFAPILIALLLSVLTMLTQVGWRIVSGDTLQPITTPKGIIEDGADNLRWYVLAFVGLLTALAGILGTPLTLIRVWTTERQTSTAEQGLITDRINKAVEGLGTEKNVKRQLKSRSGGLQFEFKPNEFNDDNDPVLDFKKPIYEEVTVPNIEVRIGAIYSLERIAQDSPRDHLQVMEILCAYIRENAPARTLAPSKDLKHRPKLREDIQTAIRVIGRRQQNQKSIEAASQFRLDLRDANLSGGDFSNADFSATIFYRSRFEAAFFHDATLRGVNFSHCLLNYADFRRANLTGSILDHVTVSLDGSFNHPTFTSANAFGISISGAKLTGVRYIPPQKLLNIYGDKDTEFAEGKLKNELPEALSLIDKYNLEVSVGTQEEANSIWKTINEKNIMHFSEWSPYSSNDFANGEIRTAFAKKRDLIGWPYWY